MRFFVSLRTFAAAGALALSLSTAVVAQTTDATAAQASVPSGQKAKIKGFVVNRDGDTFVIQDYKTNARTTVVLTGNTSIKTKGGFFGGGTQHAQATIMRGLGLEVEGRGDASGNLVAEKVRFGDSDLRAARTFEANVVPVESRVGEAEGRISATEQNAQRMSGQVDELSAVANAARGGAVAAQETADRAVEGVRVANDRIGSLDEYTPQQSINISFRNRSAVLSPDSKKQIDEVAAYAQTARGYLIEVTGFAYESRNKAANQQLSQQRAEAVVRYLVEQHNIPLRRIVTPYGMGAANPVADNTTREGRAENRRAEIRLLVNRGLTGSAGTDMNPNRVSSATPQE